MSPLPQPSWRDRLRDYLQREASPPHKYGHQPRLYELAQSIARSMPAEVLDDDVLFAAAFLHDLGVFIGHRPEEPRLLSTWDHVGYACTRAPDLLTQLGFPAEKIPAVLACIRQHQPQDEPCSPEATVLRDADLLEQLGAIAVLRTASKLGGDTRFHHFADVRQALGRALHDLPAQLRLPASRELAQSRVAALARFLAALDAEAGEHLG